jgi:NADH:ubiquinone oxidoreductase subunit
MTIGTRLFTWLCGAQVGQDAFGNRYFQERRARDPKRVKRWVLYSGEPEASKVPPEWHAWLHHLVAEPPRAGDRPVRDWQKPHLPNLTGTGLAYRPPGHTLKGGHRARSSGDYEPWQPT